MKSSKELYDDFCSMVAPLAGAWIEMPAVSRTNVAALVAPLAGAWIEITKLIVFSQKSVRRSPRGSVD